MKKIKQYWLVFLLAVLAMGMGIIKIKYRNVDWEENSRLITPTIKPTSAPEVDVNYPLWKQLPYQGKNFVVDRYMEPKILAVKTNSLNKKLITQEIYKWMLENKVATESHQLVFE